MEIFKYIISYFLLNTICGLIPHPKARAKYLKIIGAKIGNNVRIENIKFIQIQFPLRNFEAHDNVFIGTGVIIDLSSNIIIKKNTLISPGCSLITHQNAGDFIVNEMSKIYKTKYKPIIIENDVWVGCDSTILPGVHIGKMAVVGAKSLVREDVKSGKMVAGVPAIEKKTIIKVP